MAHVAGCGSCYVVDRQERMPVESRGESDLSSHDNETPHTPPPSLWPIGFAVGIAVLLTGLVVSTVAAVVGAVIALIFGFLWIRDVTRPVRTPAPEVEPETRASLTSGAPPAGDEEAEATYGRNTFLAASHARPRRRHRRRDHAAGARLRGPAVVHQPARAGRRSRPDRRVPRGGVRDHDVPREPGDRRGEPADDVHPQQRAAREAW